MKKQMRQAAQAYREFPWRQQVRWLMRALAGVVIVAAVLALEVHLSAQAVLLGHQTRTLQNRALQERREILDLQTRLAEMHTMKQMLRQAEAQGYEQVMPEQMHFVPVPADAVVDDSAPVQPVALANPEATPLPSEYTISLLRWLEYYLLLEPAP